jgi:hypothetical protein
MTDVFLERDFDPPLTPRNVYAGARDTAWCFDMHRVVWRRSLLSRDGRHLVCWFHAPDTESARIAVRQSGSDARRLWSGHVHHAEHGNAPTPNVAVERDFANPVRVESLQAIEDANAWCLETHRVRFVRTYASADGKRMICLYHAPDAEAVRLAQRAAGMPFTAVWACDEIAPRAS